MIPKMIHYIWLGGKPLPKVAKKCIKSWKKYCPDYEIKRWDETNLDLDKYQYVRDAYDARKYAFATDVLRCEILHNNGGVYLDIDVELIKPIDDLMHYNSFGGKEVGGSIASGLIWASNKNDKYLFEILNVYRDQKFDINNLMQITVGNIFISVLSKYGINEKDETQEINGLKIFNSEYFSPFCNITNKLKITQNTYSIHWYSSSWYTPMQKVKKFIKRICNILTFGLFGKILYKHRNNGK